MDFGQYMMIPVAPGGRDRTKIDCWGLVVLIYADMLGISLPLHEEVNWKDNGPDAVVATVEADSLVDWHDVAVKDRRALDVVILRVKGTPWHVGILVDEDRFIHADVIRGICVERLESLHWKNRVIGYHRYRNV